LGGYGVFACSHLISTGKNIAKKGASWVALFWRVLLGFVFGELPLLHLPHSRRNFCVIFNNFFSRLEQNRQAFKKLDGLNKYKLSTFYLSKLSLPLYL